MRQEKNRAEREKALQEMLCLFQLGDVAQHKPWQFSGGQAQRAALARILVSKPSLLMLDEPFSALDSYLRARLQLEMQEVLARFGQDMLLVTHDRDESYRFCREMAVMEQGRIVTRGTREEAFTHPGTAGAAVITGCKNLSPARKTGAYTIFAEDWGTGLRMREPVPEDLAAVGLRAHYFMPADAPGENAFAVADPHVSETPFSVSVFFRAGSARIRWETDRSA